MTSNILSAFNDHFVEFISDIQTVFPDDHDILMAKNSLIAIRKANPKMIIKIWNGLIVGKYKKEIEAGDLTFFINNDYSQDLANSHNSKQITDAVDRLRQPIKLMSDENKAKTIKYIQNLTKLATIFDASS